MWKVVFFFLLQIPALLLGVYGIAGIFVSFAGMPDEFWPGVARTVIWVAVLTWSVIMLQKSTAQLDHRGRNVFLRIGFQIAGAIFIFLALDTLGALPTHVTDGVVPPIVGWFAAILGSGAVAIGLSFDTLLPRR